MAGKKPTKHNGAKHSKPAQKPNRPTPPEAARPVATTTAESEATAYTPSFPVVGIGASAGGLSAFKRFFAAMPVPTGMAFVLIPHLDPTLKSLMVELLARQTAMAVCEVQDGMSLAADCVYVIPPNAFLSLSHGHLHLTMLPEPRGLQLAIDPFFRSLAADQGDRAIGIILSGTGSHGVAGLKEIKLAGGMAMAQEPGTAEYDQMPRSAIASGVVDYILPPEKMPAALVEFISQPYWNRQGSQVASEEEIPRLVNVILGLLRTQTKYDFGCYRKSMLLRRVQRRMGLGHVARLAEYVQFLRATPAEISALHKDLLIGVTAFFREPEAYQVLEQRVIPELIARTDGELPVRVWVPACASGEEAYSLAMLLIEGFTAAKKTPNVQIFATDVDGESLEAARRGIYLESITAELPLERLHRFFVRVDEHHYQVNKQLREAIAFAPQNLITDTPYSKLDLVSCRNLLIYIEPNVQQKVILLFHFALNKGGFLVLGPSETIGRETDLFEPLSKKWRVFRRIGPSRNSRVEIPIIAGERPRQPVLRREPMPQPPGSVTQLMQKLLVEEFSPAAVLINRKYEILCLQGPLSNYLEFPAGEPSKDLLILARQGLQTKIRSAVHRVLRDGKTACDVGARVKRNDDYIPCTITVRPLKEQQGVEGLLLVTFRDRVESQAAPAVAIGPAAEADEQSAVVRQLEDELKTTREDLQSTIEELESSNEELKASHEEVMSMNEEQQSANEELETSKEELQSLNEELSTVNSQLHDKLAELEGATNDMTNLLASGDIAVVFLDTSLCIRQFTPPTAKLLNLLASDVGRPFRDFSPKFTDGSLLDDCQQVLEKLTPIEREVWNVTETGVVAGGGADRRRRCYLRRILPYCTPDRRIEGVVITFVEITERLEREAQARRLATVLHDSNDTVMVHDFDGRIINWNRGAERMYGYTEAEALVMNIRELIPESRQAEALAFVHRIARGEPVDSFETQRVRKNGQILDVWLTITSLADESGGPVALATTEHDITERKKQEQSLHSLALTLEERVKRRTDELRESKDRLQAILNTAADAIITIGGNGVIETFNVAAERMFGYAALEAIGQNVKLLMPTPYREEHDEYLSHYLRTDQAKIIGIGREVAGQRKDGTIFPVDLSVSEVHHGVQKLFTGVIRDISERKELQKQVLWAAEEEQRRIGQDLHDSTQQELSGLGMIAHSLFEALVEKSAAEAQIAGRLSEGIGLALQNVRKLSRGLVPAEVNAHGLPLALTDLARQTAELYPIGCTFKCDETVELKDDTVATHLYRIAQESITNVLKHAQADCIQVSLRKTDGLITLEVLDNGHGIDDTRDGGLGIGLRAMAYRAGLIGGTLRVQRAAQGGTRVTCRVSGS